MKTSGNVTKYAVLHQYEQYNGILVCDGIFGWSYLSVLALKQTNEHQLLRKKPRKLTIVQTCMNLRNSFAT